MKKTLLSIIALIALNLGAIAQNVYIPDVNFKAVLVNDPNINTNGDTEIQVNEATAYSGAMGCNNQGINSLTGIEAFTSLTVLYCNNNNLYTLDISQNTALTKLYCNSNNLVVLDVSQNTMLQNLICDNNNLNSLDISQNTSLYNFICNNNSITSLDVSSHLNLHFLKCHYNNIATLDVSNNTLLQDLQCNNNQLTALNIKNLSTSSLGVNATSNPNLTCIEVDNVAMATANWTNVDAGVNFSLNCQPVLITSITVQGQAGATMITTQGGTLQMSAIVLPANADDGTYTWSVSNGTGSATINTSGLLTAITNGTVTVTATANDASGVSGTAVVTISNQSIIGINEQTAIHNLSIYPNPVKSQLTIDSVEKIKTIEIIDIMGKTIETTITNSLIDVSKLTKGVYFLKIQTENGLISKKFIKE